MNQHLNVQTLRSLAAITRRGQEHELAVIREAAARLRPSYRVLSTLDEHVFVQDSDTGDVFRYHYARDGHRVTFADCQQIVVDEDREQIARERQDNTRLVIEALDMDNAESIGYLTTGIVESYRQDIRLVMNPSLKKRGLRAFIGERLEEGSANLRDAVRLSLRHFQPNTAVLPNAAITVDTTATPKLDESDLRPILLHRLRFCREAAQHLPESATFRQLVAEAVQYPEKGQTYVDLVERHSGELLPLTESERRSIFKKAAGAGVSEPTLDSVLYNFARVAEHLRSPQLGTLHGLVGSKESGASLPEDRAEWLEEAVTIDATTGLDLKELRDLMKDVLDASETNMMFSSHLAEKFRQSIEGLNRMLQTGKIDMGYAQMALNLLATFSPLTYYPGTEIGNAFNMNDILVTNYDRAKADAEAQAETAGLREDSERPTRIRVIWDDNAGKENEGWYVRIEFSEPGRDVDEIIPNDLGGRKRNASEAQKKKMIAYALKRNGVSEARLREDKQYFKSTATAKNEKEFEQIANALVLMRRNDKGIEYRGSGKNVIVAYHNSPEGLKRVTAELAKKFSGLKFSEPVLEESVDEQMFSIGAGGLKELKPGQLHLAKNSVYWLGASDSPDMALVVDMDPKPSSSWHTGWVEYAHVGSPRQHLKTQKNDLAPIEDLIIQGTTKHLQSYASHMDPQLVKTLQANLKGKPGPLNGKFKLEGYKGIEVRVAANKNTKDFYGEVNSWGVIHDFQSDGKLATVDIFAHQLSDLKKYQGFDFVDIVGDVRPLRETAADESSFNGYDPEFGHYLFAEDKMSGDLIVAFNQRAEGGFMAYSRVGGHSPVTLSYLRHDARRLSLFEAAAHRDAAYFPSDYSRLFEAEETVRWYTPEQLAALAEERGERIVAWTPLTEDRKLPYRCLHGLRLRVLPKADSATKDGVTKQHLVEVYEPDGKRLSPLNEDDRLGAVVKQLGLTKLPPDGVRRALIGIAMSAEMLGPTGGIPKAQLMGTIGMTNAYRTEADAVLKAMITKGWIADKNEKIVWSGPNDILKSIMNEDEGGAVTPDDRTLTRLASFAADAPVIAYAAALAAQLYSALPEAFQTFQAEVLDLFAQAVGGSCDSVFRALEGLRYETTAFPAIQDLIDRYRGQYDSLLVSPLRERYITAEELKWMEDGVEPEEAARKMNQMIAARKGDDEKPKDDKPAEEPKEKDDEKPKEHPAEKKPEGDEKPKEHSAEKEQEGDKEPGVEKDDFKDRLQQFQSLVDQEKNKAPKKKDDKKQDDDGEKDIARQKAAVIRRIRRQADSLRKEADIIDNAIDRMAKEDEAAKLRRKANDIEKELGTKVYRGKGTKKKEALIVKADESVYRFDGTAWRATMQGVPGLSTTVDEDSFELIVSLAELPVKAVLALSESLISADDLAIYEETPEKQLPAPDVGPADDERVNKKQDDEKKPEIEEAIGDIGQLNGNFEQVKRQYDDGDLTVDVAMRKCDQLRKNIQQCHRRSGTDVEQMAKCEQMKADLDEFEDQLKIKKGDMTTKSDSDRRALREGATGTRLDVKLKTAEELVSWLKKNLKDYQGPKTWLEIFTLGPGDSSYNQPFLSVEKFLVMDARGKTEENDHQVPSVFWTKKITDIPPAAFEKALNFPVGLQKMEK